MLAVHLSRYLHFESGARNRLGWWMPRALRHTWMNARPKPQRTGAASMQPAGHFDTGVLVRGAR